MISTDKVRTIKKLISLLNNSLIHDIDIEYWCEAELSWKPFELKEGYRIKPKHNPLFKFMKLDGVRRDIEL